MIAEAHENDSAYYTLVPEQGLCCVDDVIINLRTTPAIRKLDGKTLVYRSGVAEPIILPAEAFDKIRNAVFAVGEEEADDEDEDYDEDEEEI